MRPLLALLALAPLPALAECPVAADLATGITLTAVDGGKDAYRLLPDGTVQSFYTDADGYSSRAILKDGIWLMQSLNYEGALPDLKSVLTYSYASDAFGDPLAGGEWEVGVTETSAEGERGMVLKFVFDGARDLDLGGCAYRVVDIHVYWPDWYEQLVYIPDLGFAYLAGGGEPGTPISEYPMASIAADPKQ